MATVRSSSSVQLAHRARHLSVETRRSLMPGAKFGWEGAAVDLRRVCRESEGPSSIVNGGRRALCVGLGGLLNLAPSTVIPILPTSKEGCLSNLNA